MTTVAGVNRGWFFDDQDVALGKRQRRQVQRRSLGRDNLSLPSPVVRAPPACACAGSRRHWT